MVNNVMASIWDAQPNYRWCSENADEQIKIYKNNNSGQQQQQQQRQQNSCKNKRNVDEIYVIRVIVCVRGALVKIFSLNRISVLTLLFKHNVMLTNQRKIHTPTKHGINACSVRPIGIHINRFPLEMNKMPITCEFNCTLWPLLFLFSFHSPLGVWVNLPSHPHSIASNYIYTASHWRNHTCQLEVYCSLV